MASRLSLLPELLVQPCLVQVVVDVDGVEGEVRNRRQAGQGVLISDLDFAGFTSANNQFI